MFHPSQPDHLFSCSEDGSLWHWDGSAYNPQPTSSFLPQQITAPRDPGLTSPWLSLEASRSSLDIASLLPDKSLPVNSLDIQASTLLCGTDSETLYTIELPGLR